MRFIHMADVHLGAVPDSGCPWSAFRENEIWETFVRVIDQIREEKIELLLIAGDLFHRQPLPSQTERVSQLFASIPDTEVVWMAGSHDYLREDSAYRKVKWTKNVHGFPSEKPEVISLESCIRKCMDAVMSIRRLRKRYTAASGRRISRGFISCWHMVERKRIFL